MTTVATITTVTTVTSDISPFDSKDELPAPEAALLLVSILLAALPWATAPVQPGKPRPRKTVEERAITQAVRALEERLWRWEDAKERELHYALTNGLTEIACKQVGLEWVPVEVPDVRPSILEIAEMEPEEGDSEAFRQDLWECRQIAHQAYSDRRMRTEFVIGSNRVSKHLAG